LNWVELYRMNGVWRSFGGMCRSVDEMELSATVDLLISEAVKEVLPSIEKQLTEELSKQIYQKLFPELSKDD